MSTEVFCLQVMFAWPMSPVVLNLTPSLDTEMVAVSPMEERSRQMRINSEEGIFTVAVLGVGDAEVLGVDVHELKLKVGDLVLVC